MFSSMAKVGLLASTVLAAMPALAQSAATAPQAEENSGSGSAAAALLEEIVVTGTKRSQGEKLQQVPISATALGANQLQALQVQNLESLSFSMPNVQLDQLGTQKGIANFTVRGLGVNSSVPSIEPAVGTFINGIYLGTNFGVVTDLFDVEGVEVYRGPQGVLFGRNVTGGAVNIRTARPTDRFEVNSRITFETGLNQIYAASISGPLSDNLKAKITGYYNHDDGYFKNITTGKHDGRTNTYFVRPTIVLDATDRLSLTLIGEHGSMSGDGPVARNPAWSSKFETAQNYDGYTDLKWTSATLEARYEVGDGAITNVAGYRRVKQGTGFDVDASPGNIYNQLYFFRQHQYSNELRYAGRITDNIQIIAGGFYFKQYLLDIRRDDLFYINRTADSGGQQHSNSLGFFANIDYEIVPRLTVSAGARYSRDRKRIDVATRNFAAKPCDLVLGQCTVYDFRGKKTFKSFAPKGVVKYDLGDGNVYASFSRGYRSGGFNTRSSSFTVAPGPFKDERVDAYEIGLKKDFFDRAVRLNVAGFIYDIKDLQRDTSVPSPTGFVQRVNNAANAKIKGLEGDMLVRPAADLVLRGSFGYTDGKYVTVFQDVNGDGTIDAADKGLQIPRLAKWTYGVSLVYSPRVEGIGQFNAQVNFDHRSSSFFNDANTGPLPAYDNLFASLALTPSRWEQVTVSVYGKNLLKEWNTGNNTPLGTLPGGGFIQFPTKGRIFGVELSLKI